MTTPPSHLKWDTLLLASHVLLYENNQLAVKNNQAVGVQNGRIVFIAPQNQFKNFLFKNSLSAHNGAGDAGQTVKNVYHFKNHLLCPGLVNTHTHLPMSLFRGLADDLPFQQWLEGYILPLEKEFVTKEFVKTGVYLSALELIRSGVTTVCDMYFHNTALAEALDQTGLRGLVGVGIPGEQNTKGLSPSSSWREVLQTLQKKYAHHPRIRPALAPHSAYALTQKKLKEIGEHSKKNNIFLTIHASESLWEQNEIKNKHNKTPIEYLHSLGLTGPRSLFVHCVHASPHDLQIMKETGTGFSYNPESNMKLANGIAPAAAALKAGLKVGLGTDGPASNNNHNFFAEMDFGLKLQKFKNSNFNMTAQDMLQMASLNGARALNWEDQIGSISVGKQADLIAVNLKHPHFFPGYHVVSDLVYSAHSAEVEFVMCGGKVLMENKQIKTLNEDHIYEQVQNTAKKIKKFLSQNGRAV